MGRNLFFDHLFLSCPRDNFTRKTHVVHDYQCKWQHQNGTRTPFKEFWSDSNKTEQGCDYRWKPQPGIWKCNYCDSYGEATIFGGPLGPGNKLYFDPRVDDKKLGRPFCYRNMALGRSSLDLWPTCLPKVASTLVRNMLYRLYQAPVLFAVTKPGWGSESKYMRIWSEKNGVLTPP